MLAMGSVALFALVQSGCAMDRERERTQISFEQLDIDGNGLINKKEFIERAPSGRGSPEKRFENIDEDGTGTITPEEWADARERMQSQQGSRSRGGDTIGRRGGGMMKGGW